MKPSKKLIAFNKATQDIKDVSIITEEFCDKIREIGSITISSNLRIDVGSSERQFLYALGILNHQISSCPLLNISDAEYVQKRDAIITLWKLIQEKREWIQYEHDLHVYRVRVEKLLDDNDKFLLLEYPVSPK